MSSACDPVMHTQPSKPASAGRTTDFQSLAPPGGGSNFRFTHSELFLFGNGEAYGGMVHSVTTIKLKICILKQKFSVQNARIENSTPPIK